MSPALGLLFLQGYVATPRALELVFPKPAVPDLVDRIADAIEARRPTPAGALRGEACAA